jgi:hypothetical protein
MKPAAIAAVSQSSITRLGVGKARAASKAGPSWVLATKPARSTEPVPKQEVASLTRELVPHNRPVFDGLHPSVYKVAVGLVAMFAVAAWILFDRRPDIELPLAMVSVLLFVAVLLPLSLVLIWRKYRPPSQRHPGQITFRDWIAGDLSVRGSRLRGVHAAIDVLLPLAGVAFGLTAIGIVFLICSSTAS